MFGDVFIQTGRNQLLHAKAQLPLFQIQFEHLGLYHLPKFQHVLRMLDALLRTDLADVHHALNAFGKLHEGAELGDAGDRTFDHRARRKFLRCLSPGIA